MRKLICMSFDGEYKTEGPFFKTTEEAWNHCNDMGSRWYFYPFCFVVSESGKTIVDVPDLFDWAKGLRTKTLQKVFEFNSKLQKTEGMNCEQYAISLLYPVTNRKETK